jgi:predicted tellurium resistance membrane protein TerC
MRQQEHKILQTGIALAIVAQTAWLAYRWLMGSVWSWEFNLLVVVLLTIISNGLLLERRFTQLREEMIKDKVEYGIQTGKNLKEGMDNET